MTSEVQPIASFDNEPSSAARESAVDEQASMRFGVFTHATLDSIAPHVLASAAEERGLESVWFTEHTNIPTSRATPFPAGGELPAPYKQLFDPFACIAAAAVATQRIKLATGVCLVAQRDPIVTAKEVATVDVLSAGRFQFGIGFGWNIEEIANHGLDPVSRWRIGRENVLAMRELWTQEEAEFDGEFVRLERTWQWPKPAQRPHPPIYLGGQPTKSTFRRIAEYADGWLVLGDVTVERLQQSMVELEEALDHQGRAPTEVEVVPYGVGPDPARLGQLYDLGVRRVVLRQPSLPEADALRHLDKLTTVIAAWSR